MSYKQTYSDWRLLNRIGGGGDSDVYRCKRTDGIEAAIKVLQRNRKGRRDRTIRFSNEVRFLISQGCRPGILPLLDHALPDDPNEPSWYVMPMAVPLREALGATSEFRLVVEAVTHIARTLAGLAAEGISHQDIKPNNLFRLNSEWVIGDFGYVKHPEQDLAARQYRRLMPRYSIAPVGIFTAPEVKRKADVANAEQADVYALAKTLWAVATGCVVLTGVLRRERPELRLSSYVKHHRARLLEPLLEWCTADDPLARPTLHEMVEALYLWTESSVSTQSDLSYHMKETQRLRSVTSVSKKETQRR